MSDTSTRIDNLRQYLESRLDKLSLNRDGELETLRHHEQDREVLCSIASADRLACEVNGVYVRSPSFQNWDAARADDVAEAILKRVTYLEEQLICVERDNERVEWQIRSEKPQAGSQQGKCYFELLVGQAGIAMHRYYKERDRARQKVNAVLTRPIFYRLVGDLFSASVN